MKSTLCCLLALFFLIGVHSLGTLSENANSVVLLKTRSRCNKLWPFSPPGFTDLSFSYTHKNPFLLEVNALKTSYRNLCWNCSMSTNSQRIYREMTSNRKHFALSFGCTNPSPCPFMWINFINGLLSLWISTRYTSKILSLVPKQIKNIWKHWLSLSVLNL